MKIVFRQQQKKLRDKYLSTSGAKAAVVNDSFMLPDSDSMKFTPAASNDSKNSSGSRGYQSSDNNSSDRDGQKKDNS